MTLLVLISFLSAIMNIPFTIAVNLGLKFKEDDPNCPEDVKTVRDNIRSVKAIQTINANAMEIQNINIEKYIEVINKKAMF